MRGVRPVRLKIDHLLEALGRELVVLHLVSEDRRVEVHRVVVFRVREPRQIDVVHP